MKITDIQIGDWLQNTNGNIGKAQAIYRYPDYEKEYEKDEFRYEVVMEYSPNSTCYSELSLLKQIPLTAQILEKNGFEHEWWWRLKGEDFWLCQSGDEWRAYSNEDSDKRDNFCWLSSVHELQHCLRLLKIDKEIVL